MKFASFKHEGRNQAGVVTGEIVLALPRLGAAAGVTLPDTLLDLIRGGESSMNAVRDAVAAVERANRVTEVGLPAASVELLPPLPSPPKVICVARNYAEHAREAGLELPKMPILFPRFANTRDTTTEPKRTHSPTCGQRKISACGLRLVWPCG